MYNLDLLACCMDHFLNQFYVMSESWAALDPVHAFFNKARSIFIVFKRLRIHLDFYAIFLWKLCLDVFLFYSVENYLL